MYFFSVKIAGESKKKNAAKKSVTSKEKILQSIEKGMKQVRGIEKGKLKSISLKQLLDALKSRSYSRILSESSLRDDIKSLNHLL
jgi:hypothetical protein